MYGNRSCSGADQKTEVYETFPFVISATNALIEILINVERQSHSALAKFVPPLANEPHRIQMLGKRRRHISLTKKPDARSSWMSDLA
jgi:hypothetical protein